MVEVKSDGMISTKNINRRHLLKSSGELFNIFVGVINLGFNLRLCCSFTICNVRQQYIWIIDEEMACSYCVC